MLLSIGTNNGVELEAIYVKAFAHSIYPLKSCKTLYRKENSPDLIEEASFFQNPSSKMFFLPKF
jgi:hypothetical protein